MSKNKFVTVIVTTQCLVDINLLKLIYEKYGEFSIYSSNTRNAHNIVFMQDEIDFTEGECNQVNMVITDNEIKLNKI